MSSNNFSEPIIKKGQMLVEILYSFYALNRKGRYTVYALTLLIVLIYAFFNDLVFGRPEEDVAKECIVLTSVLILTLPLSYYHITSNEIVRPKDLISLLFIFSVFGIVLLFGTGRFYLLSIEKLEADLSRTREEVLQEKSKSLPQVRPETVSPKDWQERVEIKLKSGGEAIIGEDLIHLIETTDQNNLSGLSVVINVESPNHIPQRLIFSYIGDTKIYIGNKCLEIKLLNANSNVAHFMIIPRSQLDTESTLP